MYPTTILLTNTLGLIALRSGMYPTTILLTNTLGLIAQSVEQKTLNLLVAGSNPAQPKS